MTQGIDPRTKTSYFNYMKRWIWLVIAIGLSSGTYMVVRYGLRPKPIPVMAPTEFLNTEQIGGVVYKHLRQNLRAERVVLLGSTPGVEDDRQVWLGLTAAAQADGERLVTFVEEDIQKPNFIQSVKASMQAGQLIVVHGLTTEVSHLVAGSVVKRLETVVGHPVLTISTMSLVIDPGESDTLQTQCLDATETKAPMQRLDCAANRVARKYLKRRLEPSKNWAVMERYGLKEYLLFIHRP